MGRYPKIEALVAAVAAAGMLLFFIIAGELLLRASVGAGHSTVGGKSVGGT